MAKATTLKDVDNNVMYPVGKSTLVYRNDNTNTVESSLATIESAIDKTLVKDFSINENPSTTTIILDKEFQNIKSGTETTGTVTFPVASANAAGVMNSATFQAVQDNTTNINAILNGAVAVSGLPANPTQEQITTAWQTETGLTEIINGAKVFDQTNSRTWTYYTNTEQWYPAGAGGSVTVSQFTNTSLGTIKGSEIEGQVFAESDGTGSVNGWDTLSNQVSTNTSNISNEITNRTTADTDLQNQINLKANASDLHNGVLTLKQNNVVKDTFSANTSENKTVNIECVTATDILETEAVTPIVNTGLIVNKAVTTDKLDDEAVNADKINWGALSSRIQAGTAEVDIYLPGSSEYSTDITFPTPFENTPKVLVTPVTEFGGHSPTVAITNVSTTGFTAIARWNFENPGATIECNWLAIDL